MVVAERRTIVVYETDYGTFRVVARHGNIVELHHDNWDATFPARLDDDGLLTDESWAALSHMSALLFEAYGHMTPPQPIGAFYQKSDPDVATLLGKLQP